MSKNSSNGTSFVSDGDEMCICISFSYTPSELSSMLSISSLETKVMQRSVMLTTKNVNRMNVCPKLKEAWPLLPRLYFQFLAQEIKHSLKIWYTYLSNNVKCKFDCMVIKIVPMNLIKVYSCKIYIFIHQSGRFDLKISNSVISYTMFLLFIIVKCFVLVVYLKLNAVKHLR